MDEHTRAELEFLSRWYALVRSATLRLLRELTEEELTWRPAPGRNSCGWILAHLAVSEELHVQRRLAGRTLLPDAVVRVYRSGSAFEKSRKCPLRKHELERLLKNLKIATLRFLRSLAFESRQPQAPDVVRQLERLIFHESQHLGQMHYLRALRSGEPSRDQTRRQRL